MDRILVPLDGSELSEAVLPVAETLARAYGAELLVLRAVRIRGGVGPGLLEPKMKVREAERYLAHIAMELQARGLSKIRRNVSYSDATPDRVIAEAAAQHRVDLIVMTTHGRGGLGRLLLGSVAESVVRHAPAPVLLIRGQPSWRPGSIGKILIPLDGSELSAAILPIVERLAGPLDVPIALLHVVEPLSPSALTEVSSRREELTALRQADAESYLSKVAGTPGAKGLRVQRDVRVGSVVEVIREFVRDEGIGLIAMTTHGRTGLGRVFFGSVAERVLRAATVPVLLWKARED